MNWFKKIKISKTLYHGTSINNYNSIKEVGLVPRTGDFVQDAYGSEYEAAGVEFDPIPLVYATDKEEINRAVTAMTYSVSKLLGKTYHEVTPEDIRSFGMLVIIREGEKYFSQRPHENGDVNRDWQYETDNKYPAVEPGDYYSEDMIDGDILIGNKLVTFLKKIGYWPTNFEHGVEELRKQLLTMAIRYHVSQSPESQKEIVKEVKDKVSKLDYEALTKYYNTYKDLLNNDQLV